MHKGAGITLKQRLLSLKINNKKLCHAYACFLRHGRHSLVYSMERIYSIICPL